MLEVNNVMKCMRTSVYTHHGMMYSFIYEKKSISKKIKKIHIYKKSIRRK